MKYPNILHQCFSFAKSLKNICPFIYAETNVQWERNERSFRGEWTFVCKKPSSATFQSLWEEGKKTCQVVPIEARFIYPIIYASFNSPCQGAFSEVSLFGKRYGVYRWLHRWFRNGQNRFGWVTSASLRGRRAYLHGDADIGYSTSRYKLWLCLCNCRRRQCGG